MPVIAGCGKTLEKKEPERGNRTGPSISQKPGYFAQRSWPMKVPHDGFRLLGLQANFSLC